MNHRIHLFLRFHCFQSKKESKYHFHFLSNFENNQIMLILINLIFRSDALDEQAYGRVRAERHNSRLRGESGSFGSSEVCARTVL